MASSQLTPALPQLVRTATNQGWFALIVSLIYQCYLAVSPARPQSDLCEKGGCFGEALHPHPQLPGHDFSNAAFALFSGQVHSTPLILTVENATTFYNY